MIINVMKEYKKALKLEIDTKVGRDDPNVTYQEYFFYLLLYSFVNKKIASCNPDEEYELFKGIWMDKNWDTMKASKFHKKVFDKPWDQVFIIN